LSPFSSLLFESRRARHVRAFAFIWHLAGAESRLLLHRWLTRTCNPRPGSAKAPFRIARLRACSLPFRPRAHAEGRERSAFLHLHLCNARETALFPRRFSGAIKKARLSSRNRKAHASNPHPPHSDARSFACTLLLESTKCWSAVEPGDPPG